MKTEQNKDMRKFGGMEFSTFRLKEGITEEALFAAVDQMVEGLYSDEADFISHAILKGDDDVYVDVVFASSKESAAYLCGKWGQGPFATEALSYMDKIEPGSANLAFYQRIK